MNKSPQKGDENRLRPNSLDCTDLNHCGVRRDAELCRLCYKQKENRLDVLWCQPIKLIQVVSTSEFHEY